MKKIIVIALSALVSACACFDCADENERTVTYQTTSRDQKLECDYFDGKTCYRYIYKDIKRQVTKPEPVRQRPCGAPVIQNHQPAPCGCPHRIDTIAPAPVVQPVSDNCCQDKISETREPVELVYKKVTTKTTYEPKTSSQVTYEKVPYNSNMPKPEPVEVVAPNPAPIPVPAPVPATTTTTTVIEEIK